MMSNIAGKDYRLESQSTIKYKPTRMKFREYDKKMMKFCPGLKYWQLVLDSDHEWNRQDPVLDSRGLPVYMNVIKQTVDHYTPDEH
jgi:hypothetical protein